MDKKFRQEREAALNEIQTAIGKKITELAIANQTAMANRPEGLLLPEHVQTYETFRWPAAISFAAGDLKEEKSLKEIFSRVSARYEGKDLKQILGVADDFTRSPAAKLDGRTSAFEDVLKVLDVAERDFDLTYKPLTRSMLDYWHKKHPIDDQHLEYAYRENQRYYMKESIKAMREFLTDLQAGKPAPGVAPKPPKP